MRVRTVAKSAFYLRHVRTYQCGSNSTGLQWTLTLGISRKSVEKVQFWLNSDKNIRALYTRRARDVLLFRRNRFATKALLCNSQYLYIVDTDTWYFVWIATMVTRIHHIVTSIRTLPNTSRSKPPMACHVPTMYYLQDTDPPFSTLTVVQIIEEYPALKGRERSLSCSQKLKSRPLDPIPNYIIKSEPNASLFKANFYIIFPRMSILPVGLASIITSCNITYINNDTVC
jgi:hypothetical protein